MSSPEVIKPNDTGIDLKSAALPSAIVLEEEKDLSQDVLAPEPVQEEDPAESVRQESIAMEDRVARRELILNIRQYYSSPRFSKFLVENELVEDLSQLLIPEMQQLLGDIKFAIQNKNTGNLIQRGVPQIICALEPLICSVYDVKGLSNSLLKNETFKDILEEVALESRVFSNTPASTRLFYEVIKTGFFTHEMNAAMAAIAKEKAVKVSSSTAELMS
jgi:hypothetical protein